MEKLITLRYAGTCKRCGQVIPAGSRAVWLGSGKGSQHQTCTPQREEIEKPKENTAAKIDRMIFDYSTLREDFGKFVDDASKVYTQPQNHARGRSLAADWKGDWAGCTDVEMAEFIRAGYHVSGLDGISSLIPAKPRRKVRYSDEGDELLIDLAWSGSDEPFIEWEKRVSKPGLSVEIHMTFNAMFPAATITQYQRWIARALQTLDENGVDMEVNLIIRGKGASDDDYATCHETLIRVRKPGEASDFANWSPMFSPGGFRMLGIMAVGKHVDATRETIAPGYGSSDDYGAWTVAYDEETNRVVIGNNGKENQFPEFEMTQKLQAVLVKLNG